MIRSSAGQGWMRHRVVPMEAIATGIALAWLFTGLAEAAVGPEGSASNSSSYSNTPFENNGPRSGTVSLGFQVGGNVSSYSTSPSAYLGYKAGLVAGGQAEIPLAGRYSLEPEVRLTQKGFNYSATVANIQTIATGTANYLEFPVLVKVNFPELHPVTPFVFAGPDLGVNLGTSATQWVNGINQGYNGLAFNTLDFALEMGAGVSYPIHREMRIFGRAEYSLGLVNVSSFSGESWKSQGIQIIAGMMFGLL